MRIAIYRRLSLALLPGLFLSTALVGEEPRVSARRTIQLADPPPEVILPEDVESISPIQGDHSKSEDVPTLDEYPLPGDYTPSCESGYVQDEHAVSDGACIDPYCFCPCWTFRAGAVVLRRDSDTPVAIATGTPSYSTGALGFDYEVGPQFTVIRHGILGSDYDFEINYFGVSDWGATANTADIDTVATLPAINVVGVTPASTTYASRLHSTEFNLRTPASDWITLLGGFRWVEIGEDLNTNIGGAATHRIDVNNHLYGVQLGLDAVLIRRSAWSVEAFGKAGIYGNSADATTLTTGVGGALPAVDARRDSTAFLGETALTAVYDITPRWSLRGGYQLTWIDGVALAPEQLDNVNIATGAATLDTRQTSFYHGFTVAAQYSW